MFAVFDRIGYALGNGESDWDVLWSHEYPFESLAKKMSVLKPHQKVSTSCTPLCIKKWLLSHLSYLIRTRRVKCLGLDYKHKDMQCFKTLWFVAW